MEFHLKMLKNCKILLPTLTNNLHKGQCGRIGIIGGCEEYTGAPYYAAISALRTGADLVYVFCFKSAAPIIKSYSPELIVLPYLDSPNALEKIKPWLQKLHSLVVGPGLGSDMIAQNTVKDIFQYISGNSSLNKNQVPIIADADSLTIIESDTFKNYSGCVYLTPNVHEFSKLSLRLINHQTYKPTGDDIQAVLKKLDGNYTLILKAEEDMIVNKRTTTINREKGSSRRCGGQGDILAGSLGTFAYWATKQNKYNECDPEILAAYAATSLTKYANKITFESKERSMITTDIIKNIPKAFQELFTKGKD
ncbi:ATP-dependent (S)-NAD(P)H-hydrate dehydratase [Daktulosphaira vitifoliae]|uniref:ATP-dependent (S)-NAD(P)H-hydrate dehydratase n=1 Tax=Daktulosphaira vitifoliae TaxID=58002 RepID=UPI0021A99399|nr:ATP-dependent (S)-NAD(P)H-hydrate dehydratase [Daktulosphaira vitifoliae]XP_050525207.1 ATP-dependent (S)-NAD(P)H-hydrate dehydratase [Daktulosphaira vitifoliae]XP_050525208.1 ATP-dependent (S)-NAD(P)H-hydrate dehydratase [Daktulosphaira vitifoliae]XP_050525209.1 ATP-dependent (S)-NAD(P)H-hydrate dehydratase [Daktulosphaira vitifoliae]XP_050525210.1 ATP-dependent (S)-NAD(P)H-hydrate dehydratase [Daktulosphaira vitifoliae]XP_050525211.1 ATP-dependent (S)-NAD(P)H-hydrate dehydratase [Daktulos